MEIALLDQTRVFVFASVMGLCLGAVYDLFSFFPEVFGKKILEPIFDILYCIVFMGGFIALVQLKAQGEIRWYIPGGIILGLILYFCGLSDYVKMVMSLMQAGLLFIKKLLAKILGFIASLFESPRGS